MRVRYSGGSLDGVVMDDAPEVLARHPQREVHGDGEHGGAFELYRNAGDDEGSPGTVVFEFVSAADVRVLDDGQNYPARGAEAGAGA